MDAPGHSAGENILDGFFINRREKVLITLTRESASMQTTEGKENSIQELKNEIPYLGPT